MNKRLSALLLAGLLPLCAAESLAATSGQIDLTGRVADGTCSITGLDQVIQMKNLPAAEINAAAHNALLAYYDRSQVSIENCPAGMTAAHLRLDYDAENNPEYIKMTTGSAPGVSLYLNVSGQVPTAPGFIRTIPLNNGAGAFNYQPVVKRNVNDPDRGTPAENVSGGTYGAVVSLSLSFD